MNNRLELLYPQKSHSHHGQTSIEKLESQNRNFFIIGIDGKNPWNAHSFKLRPLDVLELTKSGHQIRATPHIGLHWANNSMYPFMGVKICDYMANQSIIDTADEPHNIIENGAVHNCAMQYTPVLSPYLVLDSSAIQSNGYMSAKKFADKNNLGYVHHTAKKLALGEENLMLDADLLAYPWIFDFFQVLVENERSILQGYDGRTGIFDRHVSVDGVVQRLYLPGGTNCIDGFLEMKACHAEMIRNDRLHGVSGNLPLKEAVILLDSIVSYWQQIELSLEYSEIGDTYHTSGSSMINYTKSQPLRDVLDRMYKALLNSGKFAWLPRYMAHTILPGGTFCFLPSNAEEDLCEAVYELLNLNDERLELSTFLGQKDLDSNTRANWLLHNRNVLNPAFVAARKKFRELADDRRGFSQYDLLNGEYVPRDIVNRLMEMTFEQIQNLFKV